MEDITDGFRFLVLFIQVSFFALNVVMFYVMEDKDKLAPLLWMVVLLLNFWLLYQAAVTGSVI